MLAALVTPRRTGVIATGGTGVLRQSGPRGGTVDLVERAVYRSLSQPMGPRAIQHQHGVRESLDKTRDRLVAAGLLLPVWRRLVLRVTPLAVVILAGLSVPTTPLTWSIAGAGSVLAVGSWWLPHTPARARGC